VFEQHHVDLLGLATIAVGVFLGFILYGHGDGGRLGHWIVLGLADAVGELRYAAPAVLAAVGAALLLGPVLPTLRPLRAGGACLLAAALLGYAAGTLGLGPAGARHGYFHLLYMRPRGGLAGDALLYAAAHLVSTLGANILAVFLLLAGVLLVSGASLATVLQVTGTGIAQGSRTVTRSLHGLGSVRPPAPRRPAGPVRPPEPAPSELIVRSTHVEAPPLDTAEPARLFDQGDSLLAPEPDDDEPPEPELEPEPDSAVAARPPAESLTPQGRLRADVTDDPDFTWTLPRADQVLQRSRADQSRPDTAGLERIAGTLVEALGHFSVEAKVIGMVAGPHITRFELRLAPGVKMSKVSQLKDDLAYALATTDIRILAPIPGKQAVGVEVPNAKRRIVRLGDVYQEPPPDWSPLTVWLGKDVAGKAIGADLARMPHLLVAGTTGAGKSGAINAMLASVLLRATPHEVRMVLVDPKQVELNHYESIPHLLTPVITSPRMAANALQNLVREMESRYGIMSMARTRSLPELNRVRDASGEPRLPYILCVIDELADLMMVAPADVITGMIKANVPSRIAFAVSSQTDSRVILDQNGAESLLGQGDMLFSPVGTSRLQRIQGAYIDEPQIAALTDLWRRQGEPEFREELLEEVEAEAGGDAAGDEFDPDEDALLEDAIRLVAEMQTASTSMLQRRLRLGYTRAGRLIDMLERRGVISGYEGSKPRQVLVSESDLPRVLSALREREGVGDPGAASPGAPELE
jgi:S-DNA-T family DNA segregation ATPase FtsK/SpoIIIE